MDTRSQDTQANKTSSARHRERSSDESADRRPSENQTKHQDEKRPIRRVRSPSLLTRPFRPRFGGRFFRPRFFPGKEEGFFRRPGFSFGFQRYPPFYAARLHHRPYGHSTFPPGFRSRPFPFPGRGSLRHHAPFPSPSPAPSQLSEKSSSASARGRREHSSTPRSSGSSSREKDRQSLSFTVSQKGEVRGNSEGSSSVTRAAARNRAIQRKRREIEEVYRQDCDTFGVVVKMLVAKDPSLERPIQSSLQDNLREIGMRCVQAMEHFIQEYDSQEPCEPLTSDQH